MTTQQSIKRHFGIHNLQKQFARHQNHKQHQHEKKNTSIFTTDCIVYRLGKAGYKMYYSGTLSLFVQPQNDYKLKGEARVGLQKNLVFNGVFPQNAAVVYDEEEPNIITIAKIASTTYTNGAGLPIPTIWKFKFSGLSDTMAFLYFVKGACGGAKINKAIEKKKPEGKKKPTKTTAGNKENKQNGKKTTSHAAAPFPSVVKKDGKKSYFDLSFLSDSEEEDKSYGYDESDNDNDSLGGKPTSPVFAQSQDVYASVRRFLDGEDSD